MTPIALSPSQLDADWNVKLADFGLSRHTSNSNNSTLSKLRGTLAYCAPEVFQGEKFSTSSDIYSLGIIFWVGAAQTMSDSSGNGREGG